VRKVLRTSSFVLTNPHPFGGDSIFSEEPSRKEYLLFMWLWLSDK